MPFLALPVFFLVFSPVFSAPIKVCGFSIFKVDCNQTAKPKFCNWKLDFKFENVQFGNKPAFPLFSFKVTVAQPKKRLRSLRYPLKLASWEIKSVNRFIAGLRPSLGNRIQNPCQESGQILMFVKFLENGVLKKGVFSVEKDQKPFRDTFALLQKFLYRMGQFHSNEYYKLLYSRDMPLDLTVF